MIIVYRGTATALCRGGFQGDEYYVAGLLIKNRSYKPEMEKSSNQITKTSSILLISLLSG